MRYELIRFSLYGKLDPVALAVVTVMTVLFMIGAIIHNFDDGRLIIHGPGASALRLVLSAPPKASRASQPAREIATTHQPFSIIA